MPRIPYEVAPHSVPGAASGTYLLLRTRLVTGSSTKQRDKPDTHTAVRSCGIPRNTETKYRYPIFLEYPKIPGKYRN